MNRWLYLVALLFLVRTPAVATIVDGVAVVVDGLVITRSEVEEAANLERRLGGLDDDVARRRAVQSLIEKVLVEREADRLGVAVGDEELERALCEICERTNLERVDLPSALEGQGVDYEAYLAQVRAQIQRVKLASRVLRSRLEVSDESLREYYLKNVAEFRELDAIHLRHIQFPAGTDISKAEAVRSKVLAGEDFMEVARALSAETGSPAGSDMGFLTVKSLSGPVLEAISGLAAGQVTSVVEIRGAYHLFWVADRKKGGIPEFEQVRSAIEDRYFRDREQELYRSWIDSLKQRARIEVKL